MARLTAKKCENFVWVFFLEEGVLPAGTTRRNILALKVSDLGLDDPPLPGDPHFQKKKAARRMQVWFLAMGYRLTSPLPILRDGKKSLRQLATWIREHHEEARDA
ncbi:MAG: hypothetical protein JXP34_17910 [Planctomycetes bacterium]|nr:hypothetical protein [Planctomycetota bacterium]